MNGNDIERFKAFKEKVQEDAKEKKIRQKELRGLIEKGRLLSRRETAAQNAREVIKQVALDTQKNLEYHVSHLVTLGLTTVFPYPPNFVARMEDRRNKTECDLMFEKFGEEYKPKDGSGWGPIDVASFALVPTYWSLNKNRPVFALDEPFRHVSPDLQEAVSDMVKRVSQELKIQIIMVSHAEDINTCADKTFEMERMGDRTVVTESGSE